MLSAFETKEELRALVYMVWQHVPCYSQKKKTCSLLFYFDLRTLNSESEFFFTNMALFQRNIEVEIVTETLYVFCLLFQDYAVPACLLISVPVGSGRFLSLFLIPLYTNWQT